jgi:hypothetical protein
MSLSTRSVVLSVRLTGPGQAGVIGCVRPRMAEEYSYDGPKYLIAGLDS